MGCDGGTIPKRHELVKGPKKVEKVDKDAELVALWNYCALSQEILRRPIVACELGRLYNKDAVIEFLLDKSSEKALAKAASHIKNIKHVTELRLSDNPAWEGDKGNTKGDKHDDLQRARFICPVVGLEMNGRHRFCFLRCCGCVFSERALKEIRAEVCHTKTKKPKAAEAVSHPAAGEASEGPSGMNMGKPEASSLDPREKKVGPAPRSAAASGSSSGKAGKPPCGATKRSIAQSEESEAYKSLFTTHSSAKRSKEESAHWVTHTSYCF
ncbi:replication termination factor 2 isoform X3 [Pipistrellus kuhlii]|uniref:replication termination factor 2 isoform X3 n=1 Tax=Pipistrellus kuhlii TaxID=59472 RepID=UPI001E272E4F|nr:replication termination factor 2 isoform X3 [Pipistrellus kuhlii]